jgi:hypothetical protein
MRRATPSALSAAGNIEAARAKAAVDPPHTMAADKAMKRAPAPTTSNWPKTLPSKQRRRAP